MNIKSELYGKLPTGEPVYRYTLENKNGMQVSILNFGGIIQSVIVPDKNGKMDDVVLAQPNLEEYLLNPGSHGMIVGRNSNRIKGAVLEIGGNVYNLDKNSGENNIHGGPKGIGRRLFQAEARTVNNQPALLLSLTIPDMDDGFPGTLNVNVAYALVDDNSLMIDYRAVCDKDTIINLTNHAYFNLAGHNSGPVYDQLIQVDADFYSPNQPDGVPTGEILSVAGTPYDLREPKKLGDGIHSDHPQIKLFNGYDNNLALNGMGYRKIATMTDPASGRVMHTFTDLPGVQLYSGNGLNGKAGKDGAAYQKHQGLCLETQLFPNSAQMPWLISPVYPANIEFISTTTYMFDVL